MYGKLDGAHRISWEIAHGCSIPDGLNVLHKCNNRACVNPDHLYLGTQKENVRDAINGGTFRFVHLQPNQHQSVLKGEEKYNAKLTDDKVREIRKMRQSGKGCRELGRIFKVDHTIISEVANRKIWKHVV